jgi:gamma-glutamyltranspeptidase / glutathione hydrolase
MREAVRGDRGMVATSQPLATDAGLALLRAGGNAADAALAAAAVLCVTEPMSTGLGGDAFALVWRDGELHALDAAGPAPRSASPDEPVAERGPTSVTVPGAVAGWGALAERFGRLGLERCLQPAIEIAEAGFEPRPITAEAWRRYGSPDGFPEPAPDVRLPALARTLRTLAREGASCFYAGPIADAIVAASWLEPDDLAGFSPRWVEPLRQRYRGVTVVELPPPTQGVVALEALALLEPLEPSFPELVRCVALALEDGLAHVRDGADVGELLEGRYLERRRGARPVAATEPGGGTVYLCAVDEDRMAVSFIQSLYMDFGSRVVAGDTGVVLQNRGACFAVNGRVEPGRRPYHTIIPGMLLRDGELLGPFGIMGGFVQAQAHAQFVSALVDDGLDPQQALDRPRFMVAGDVVELEAGLLERGAELEEIGYRVVAADRPLGGGQAILLEGDELVAGSDTRKDGYAGALHGDRGQGT